jgi:hypothetical protein
MLATKFEFNIVIEETKNRMYPINPIIENLKIKAVALFSDLSLDVKINGKE